MEIVTLNVSIAILIFVFRIEKVLWCTVIKKRVKSYISFLWVQAVVKLEQSCDCYVYSMFFST